MHKAMRTVLAGFATAMAVAAALPTAPAYAIDDVPCGSRDYLIIENDNGGPNTDRHCFANEGARGVHIYGVKSISSGDNKVVINYIRNLGEGIRSMTLEKRSNYCCV